MRRRLVLLAVLATAGLGVATASAKTPTQTLILHGNGTPLYETIGGKRWECLAWLIEATGHVHAIASECVPDPAPVPHHAKKTSALAS